MDRKEFIQEYCLKNTQRINGSINALVVIEEAIKVYTMIENEIYGVLKEQIPIKSPPIELESRL